MTENESFQLIGILRHDITQMNGLPPVTGTVAPET